MALTILHGDVATADRKSQPGQDETPLLRRLIVVVTATFWNGWTTRPSRAVAAPHEGGPGRGPRLSGLAVELERGQFFKQAVQGSRICLQMERTTRIYSNCFAAHVIAHYRTPAGARPGVEEQAEIDGRRRIPACDQGAARLGVEGRNSNRDEGHHGLTPRRPELISTWPRTSPAQHRRQRIICPPWAAADTLLDFCDRKHPHRPH